METTSETAGGATKAKGGVPRVPSGALLAGRFAVEGFLGASVLGEIYRATDRTDGKSVWLKLIARELLRDPLALPRLQRDVALAAQLDQKNIAATYALTAEGDGVFVACEPVDGTTLRQMLERKVKAGRAFTLKGAFNVVTHVCNALEYAHGGMAHGMLSSDTILVNTAGRVKVGDFGITRAVVGQERFRALLAPASVACLAPEFGGDPDQADVRADIYSVAALLHELLSGQPYAPGGPTLSSSVPGIPASLDAVLARSLEPDPNARFSSAHDLKRAILAATETAIGAAAAGPKGPPPTPARPPGSPPSTPPGGVSHRMPPPTPSAGQPAMAAPPVAATTSVPGRSKLPGMAAVDETRERWLIQKDKLDFGPFRLTEVKAQIEGGIILGEHTIVDMENGERRRVADHPLLRELALASYDRIESQRLAEVSAAESKARSRRATIIVGSVFGIVLVAGGVAAAFILRQQQGEKIVYRDRFKDREGDDLKGIEITMKVDPPAPRKPGAKHHGPHTGTKNANGEWSDTTNLGDAAEGGGDETLDQNVVQKVMVSNFGVLKGCVLEERQRNKGLKDVEMDFIIKGSGQVAAVKVNGDTASPFASCMYAKMQSVSFPKFNGQKTHASFSLALK